MAILETRNILTAIAGENITAGQYCFILHPDAPYTYIDGASAGRAYTTTKSIRHRSINANLAGFALDTVSAGQSVRILEEGRLSGFNGLVAGQCYQPANTAGTIEVLENNRAALPSPIAQAISTTDLNVFRQSWGVRGKGYWVYSAATKLFTFSTESMANGNGRTVASGGCGCSSSSLTMYAMGCGTTNLIERFLFSTEVLTDIGDLALQRNAGVGAASAIKSYLLGGHTGAQDNTIDAVTHATEGNAVDIGNISSARSYLASSTHTLCSYAAGGSTGSAVATIDKFVWSTEGDSTNIGNMSTTRLGGAGFGSNIKGYFLSGSNKTSIDAMPIATEVSATIGSVLGTGRSYFSGCSCAVCGVISGGDNSGYKDITDRLMFATEVASLSTPALTIHAYNGSSAS
jgi:hypothetical protein